MRVKGQPARGTAVGRHGSSRSLRDSGAEDAEQVLRFPLLAWQRLVHGLEQRLQLLGQCRPLESIRPKGAADHEQSRVVRQQLKELPEAGCLLASPAHLQQPGDGKSTQGTNNLGVLANIPGNYQQQVIKQKQFVREQLLQEREPFL